MKTYRIQVPAAQLRRVAEETMAIRITLLDSFSRARACHRTDIADILAQEWHQRFHTDIRQERTP